MLAEPLPSGVAAVGALRVELNICAPAVIHREMQPNVQEAGVGFDDLAHAAVGVPNPGSLPARLIHRNHRPSAALPS